MDDTTRALATRAVRCKAWRWMDGMRFDGGFGEPRGRVIEGGGVGDYIIWHGEGPTGEMGGLQDDSAPPTAIPDLTDPATLGCLLALVREAWGDPLAHAWGDRRTGRWSWHASGCVHSIWRPEDADGYATEAEALAAALEAAP